MRRSPENARHARRRAELASLHDFAVVASRIIAPPTSDQGPGRSACTSHAHTGFSTGSRSSKSEASSAVTDRKPRVRK